MTQGPRSLDTSHLKRRATLRDVVSVNNWRLVQDATMKILDGSSLYDLARTNRHYENYIFGDDWEYVEVCFKTYGHNGRQKLKQKTVHYGVMSVKLPRRLPNVVFDSLKHQKRQFRIIFEGNQRISLEGNFDHYFATYFGKGYIIDDLSFITPEVMEALITAQDYDVEIVHNSLLIFGPLDTDPARQLREMSSALQLIRKKLLNNILTYRDERVPYSKGRRVVARAGMFLGKRYVMTPRDILIASIFALPVVVMIFLLLVNIFLN